MRLLPHPFTGAKAGYRYDRSILQAEVSLTQVLDRPARLFFEQVIRENLDLGAGAADLQSPHQPEEACSARGSSAQT